MAAGVFYDEPMEVERELYAVKSGYRLEGGFNLSIEGLTAQTHIPTLCPLHINFADRTASVVDNIKVVARAEGSTTTLKIAKGSFAKVGSKYMLSSSIFVTVSAIDASDEAFDSLTVSTTQDAIPEGSVMTACTEDGTATAIQTANALNYTRTKIEAGASVTALGRAYEIKEADLYIPVTEEDKVSLTDRFMFIPLK